MKTAITLTLVALLGFSQPALACGFCGGDKAASVYSFKNKQFAERTNSRYVSVELAGDGDEEDFNRAVEALKRINGIYKNTFRTAYAQKAVSFVFKTSVRFEDLSRAFSESRPGWSMKLVEDIK